MKMLRLTMILAAAIPLFAQSDVTLQRAIRKETVEGDLKGAIELYRKAAAEAGKDRTTGAQALLHLAQCYEKQGNAEARATYERVVREYADQKESAAIARTRLGSDGASGERGMVVRRVWDGEDASMRGRPSADGRYFAYVDWKSGGNLAVRDLASGVNRVLTNNASNGAIYRGRPLGATRLPGDRDHSYAGSPVFSPDAKQIAYTWHTPQEDSVRIVRMDGSGMRILWRTELGASSVGDRPRGGQGTHSIFGLPSWSPDGRQLALVTIDMEQRSSRIALLSVQDGSLQYLKSPEWRSSPYLRVGSFSPDGRFLVYSLPPSSPSAADGGVFTLATDGRAETALIRGPWNNDSPAWSPDGQTIVFVSDRFGSKGIWAIRVADGKPQGLPQLLKPNTGDIEIRGFSRDGSCFYGALNHQRDVYEAGLDPETLRVTTPPKRLMMVGSNWGPAWSPDGKWIAFYRGMDPAAKALAIRSMISGEERTLPTKFERGWGGTNMGPAWFPDSRAVLVPDVVKDRVLYRRIDVENSREQVVLDGPYPDTFLVARLSPDGKALYHVRRIESEQTNHLMKRNLETGEDVELYRAKTSGIGFFGIAVSPDGAWLTFSVNDKPGGSGRELMTLSTQGGTPTILHRGSLAVDLVPLVGAWTKNSRYVLFGAVEDGGIRDNGSGFNAPVRLWAIPANGGERRRLDISLSGLHGLSFSPDHRRLVFAGWTYRDEVWVIQNLLSEMRASR